MTPERSRPFVLALTAAVLVTHAACDHDVQAASVVRADSAGVTIVRSTMPAWDSGDAWYVDGPTLSIGTVEGPTETQLFRVLGAARLQDGRIVVANAGTSELRFYGPDGHWLRSVGREGDGPGEFRIMISLQVLGGDTLLVRDDRGPRITLFTDSGNVIDARRLASPYNHSAPPLFRLPDGRWLVHAESEEVEGAQARRNALALWSVGAATTDTLLTAQGQEYLLYSRYRGDQYLGHGVVPVPFGGRDLMAIGPGRMALSDGEAYNIAVATIDGAQMRIRRQITRQPVTAHDVARFVDEYVDQYPPALQPEHRKRFRDVRPPSLLPTHAALVFDALGDLWVEGYHLPWEHGSSRPWSVFDTTGRWLGTVGMPDGLHVDEIGDDYVLGTVEDSTGVQFVKLYELVK